MESRGPFLEIIGFTGPLKPPDGRPDVFPLLTMPEDLLRLSVLTNELKPAADLAKKSRRTAIDRFH